MRYALFDRVIRMIVEYAELVDHPMIIVHQEHERSEPMIRDELARLRIYLAAAHHVQHGHIGNTCQRLVQLDEPRLGIGSPIDRSIESYHHPLLAMKTA